MLNEKLQKFNLNSYIEQLTTAYPSIKAIWLFGSRINNTSEENSDWDLLVFAEPHIFNQLKQDMKFRCDKVDLLIVYDGNNFEHPWSAPSRNGNAKSGSLKDWKWKELNFNQAQYESSGERIFDDIDPSLYTLAKRCLKAEKIWPKYCPL